MLHLVLLLIGLLVWIGIIYLDGLEEADSLYVLFAPELKVRKNGIRWLRTNPRKLNVRRTLKLFLCYLLVEGFKAIYLIFRPFDYIGVELYIMVAAMLLVPIAVFPFFHDLGYYHRYTILANQPTPEGERTIYDVDLPRIRIVHIGQKEALSMLIFGVGLFIGELLVLFYF